VNGYVVASSYCTLTRTDFHLQDPTLSHYSGYNEEEIQPVFKLMVDYLHKPVVHEAFFKKYASKKFLKGISLKLALCYRHVANKSLSFNTHPPMGEEVPPSLP